MEDPVQVTVELPKCEGCIRILSNGYHYPRQCREEHEEGEDDVLLVECEVCERLSHKLNNHIVAAAAVHCEELDAKIYDGKSCLIIGHGPTLTKIDMDKPYEVDVVIGIHDALHKDTRYVCSRDTNTYWQYEKQVYRYKPWVTLVLHPETCAWQPPQSDRVLYWQPTDAVDHMFTSGAYAVFWAAASGFKTIYTAGIDYWAPQNSYILDDLKDKNPENTHKSVNTHTWFPLYLPEDVIIYKAHAKSRLLCPVRAPPKTLEERREHDANPIQLDRGQPIRITPLEDDVNRTQSSQASPSQA